MCENYLCYCNTICVLTGSNIILIQIDMVLTNSPELIYDTFAIVSLLTLKNGLSELPLKRKRIFTSLIRKQK